jgi:hypothetical protein
MDDAAKGHKNRDRGAEEPAATHSSTTTEPGG